MSHKFRKALSGAFLALSLAMTACGSDTVLGLATGEIPVAAQPALVTLNEDGSAMITLTGIDGQDSVGALTVTVITLPSIGGLNVSSGAAPLIVTYTPTANLNGLDSFEFTVTDTDSFESDPVTVVLSIVPQNDAPVAVADPGVGTNEDTPVDFDPTTNDTDADGDLLFVEAVGIASNGTASVSGLFQITYTPDPDFDGPTDTFIYTVTDSSGATSSASVTVAITPVNDAPVATSDLDTTDEDSSVVVDLTGNDTDVDDLPAALSIASLDTGSTMGSVTNNLDGTVDYDPNGMFESLRAGEVFTDYFFYTAQDDGVAVSDQAVAAVEVTGVNDAPVANDDGTGGTLTTNSVTPLVIDVLANDTDVDDAFLSLVSITAPSPSGSAVINADETITFTPTHPDTGTVTFDYTVRDPGGLMSIATVSVDVSLGTAVQITGFSASPTAILAGSSTTLTWTSTAATSCAIDNSVGAVATSGMQSVSPFVSTTYTLTCQGPAGPVTAQTLVQVAIDSDGDGVLDVVELVAGWDPLDSDSDDDSLSDGEEDANANGVVDPGETAPLDPDSNDDLRCDGFRTDNDSDGIDPADACDGAEGVWLADASASGTDGLTWATAFNTIQEAIDAASPGESVWVAAGTYRAAAATDPVITMIPGISIYGGFEGYAGGAGAMETLLDQRDHLANPAILDGDQDSSGTKNANDSCHVVVAAFLARLSGFFIQGGNATCGGGNGNYGGGIYNANTVDMAFDNLVIRDNAAVTGGGLYNSNATGVTLDRVVFSGNTATAGYIGGGAMANDTDSKVAINIAVFYGNTATAYSGGITNVSNAQLSIENAAFVANGGGSTNGGALQNSDTAFTSISRAAFVRNNGFSGGAIYVASSLDAIVEDVTFRGNTAGNTAGALANDGPGTVVLSNVLFNTNSTPGNGGALYLGSPATLTNVSFTGNSAAMMGGAILTNGSGIAIRNSAFWANSGTDQDLSVASGTPTVIFTASQQDLTSYSMTNVALSGNPFTPSPTEQHIFLSTGASDLSCFDLGDDATATAAGINWSNQTTRSDGVLDADSGDGLSTGTDVDAGRHYSPFAPVIDVFTVDSSLVAWNTTLADECVIFNDADGTFVRIPEADLASGTFSHGQASTVTMSMVCIGEAGEPAVAEEAVP